MVRFVIAFIFLVTFTCSAFALECDVESNQLIFKNHKFKVNEFSDEDISNIVKEHKKAFDYGVLYCSFVSIGYSDSSSENGFILSSNNLKLTLMQYDYGNGGISIKARLANNRNQDYLQAIIQYQDGSIEYVDSKKWSETSNGLFTIVRKEEISSFLYNAIKVIIVSDNDSKILVAINVEFPGHLGYKDRIP